MGKGEKGDDQARDEVLKRMLRTPPTPHKPLGRRTKPAAKQARAASAAKARR